MLQVRKVWEFQVLSEFDIHPGVAAEVGSVALFVDLLVKVDFGIGELVVDRGGEAADFPVSDDRFGVFGRHFVGVMNRSRLRR